MLNGCVVVEWQCRARSECEYSTGRRKVSVSCCCERLGEGEGRGPEVVGKGKRAPVLAKGSAQGIVCKRIKTGA